jgi:hypothetical protein
VIRDLWGQFTGGEGTDASLGRFMAGKGWPAHLRFVDGQTARLVIGALRMMLKRRPPASRDPVPPPAG